MVLMKILSGKVPAGMCFDVDFGDAGAVPESHGGRALERGIGDPSCDLDCVPEPRFEPADGPAANHILLQFTPFVC